MDIKHLINAYEKEEKEGILGTENYIHEGLPPKSERDICVFKALSSISMTSNTEWH